MEFFGNKMNTKKHPPADAPHDELRPSKPRLRWKKEERPTGLSRIGAGPRDSWLHDGASKYACVSAFTRHTRGGVDDLWFWVAGWDSGVPHKNTCNTPCKTEADAKAAAMAYIKECLAKRAQEMRELRA